MLPSSKITELNYKKNSKLKETFESNLGIISLDISVLTSLATQLYPMINSFKSSKLSPNQDLYNKRRLHHKDVFTL
jgi:hypothetical protein